MRCQLPEGRSLLQVQPHERHVDFYLRPRAACSVPDLAKGPDLREKGLEIRSSSDPEIGRGGRRVERDRDPAQPLLDETAADGRGQEMAVGAEADDRV